MTTDQAITLAVEHHRAGRLQEAEQLYRQVLAQSPGHADALHLLGVLAHQVGRQDLAIQLITRAISVSPNNDAFYCNLGEAYRVAGMLQQAEAAYLRALQIQPNSASAHTNLGILYELGRAYPEAEKHLRKAIELDPKMFAARTDLGNVLLAQGRLDEAIEMGRQVVEMAPDYAIGHSNLGAALERKDLFKEAEAAYRRASELDPKFAEALNNLGSVIRRQGDLRTAMHWWAKSAEARPDYGEAHWNLALAALALGEFERGWVEYEWRFKCEHTRPYWREYPQPRWDGFDINGKTILLYPEQGFGDVIQFARFIPQIAARGAKVILQCHNELVELMKSAEGVAQVIGQNEAPPPFDTYLPLLSVPRVLKTTVETLPQTLAKPYIHVDPVRKAAWAERIKSQPGKLKIGLAFAGRPTPDPKRTCAFKEFAPLADVPDVTYFSLQKGEAAKQLADAPAHMKLIDLDPDLHDFADTAAVIDNLDLLISIDTAAAHLGGALLAKVWTMIPFAPDFRWMLGMDVIPWYPTMRLFRQPATDDWTSVIARIKNKLELLLK